METGNWKMETGESKLHQRTWIIEKLDLVSSPVTRVSNYNFPVSIFYFPFSSFFSHSRQGSPNVASHSWGVNGSSPALG